MRIGVGHDTHRLIEGRPLVLAGVRIDHAKGLAGHSDADVVFHAVTDALLGAAGLGDIGDAFPDDDPRWKDADSAQFVRNALERLRQSGWQPVNIDVIVFAESPKLGPLKTKLRDALAAATGLAVEAVNIKAKTGEGLDAVGRGEAISCLAVVLIERSV